MSRWQEFGFPDNLKFTSPLKAMQGITLAVEERLRPAYPDLAEEWYGGNRYQTPFIRRTLASVYQIEYGMEQNYRNQSLLFPLKLPDNALINALCTLPHATLTNPVRSVRGFWDYSKNASGMLELTEAEYTASPYIVDSSGSSVTAAENSCHFCSYETQEIPETFRFDNVFSERYFLYLYNLINPLKSYLIFRVSEEPDGSFHYIFEAEPIANLTFSD